MLTVVSIRASITFAAGQSSEIGRYEVLREESLPGLGIGMTIDDFQIAGIRHDVTELLKASLEKLGCRTPPQLHAGGVGRQQQQE